MPDPFPADELGFSVRWQVPAGGIQQAIRRNYVETVVLHCQFDDAEAAASLAQSVGETYPALSIYLALTSGQLLLLAQVISVAGRHAGSLDPAEALTGRELQVLNMIRSGSTNRDIASQLIISLSTVNRHVEHILLKLHVRNRTQAAVLNHLPPKPRRY